MFGAEAAAQDMVCAKLHTGCGLGTCEAAMAAWRLLGLHHLPSAAVPSPLDCLAAVCGDAHPPRLVVQVRRSEQGMCCWGGTEAPPMERAPRDM